MQDRRMRLDKPFQTERSSFKLLQLTNPNYFGTIEGSSLKAVQPIKGNTHYEELGCIGYHPQQRQLAGVVYVYQPNGYGSDICGEGTPEYVRFYTSTDNGATWKDQGITSFQAHNVPEGTEGPGRLEYAVSLPADLQSKACFLDHLVRVRAILSWNDPPLPNQPNWTPVWGNVREATILVEPRKYFLLPEILTSAKLTLPKQLEDLVDLEAPIESAKKEMTASELSAHYKGKVPPARFAHKEIMQFSAAKATAAATGFSAMPSSKELAVAPKEAYPALGFKLDPSILEALGAVGDGNTTYEELRCIGLDPNHPSTLVGVLQVKKDAGYSGGPCTKGSQEYVTFWADFDGNGTFETHLGTAAVRVYDVDAPDAGVHYAVRLPVDLSKHRQACKKGPKLVRIRAILSWNVPASSTNPNHVPVWGNREETTILIGPGTPMPAGKIAILGGIPVSHIDDTTGLTTPTALFATNNLAPDGAGRACAFGGRVTAQGAPLLGHTYKVEVTPVGGGAPTAVVTKLFLTRADGTTHWHAADPATLRFDYVPFEQNINGVLAQWDTAGDDLWEVKLTTFLGNTVVGTDTHRIQLDNTAPEAKIEITSGTGNCGKFAIGTTMQGTFVARDLRLGSYSLGVEPNIPGVVAPSPSSGTTQTPPWPGSPWTLNTSTMTPCGYILRVSVVDRTIVNSQSVGRHASHSVGFCLEK